MADVNRGNRPLSPHLTIYDQSYTGLASITHRITGVALVAPAVLVVLWFAAAASGPDSFGFVDGLLTSWLGIVVLFGGGWALSYHFLNGIRHLWWDTGHGLDIPTVHRTALGIAAGSVVLAFVLLILFWV